MDEQDIEAQSPEESIKRVRRGCVGMAAIISALGVMFIFNDGNLFWSIFFVIALLLMILRHYVK